LNISTVIGKVYDRTPNSITLSVVKKKPFQNSNSLITIDASTPYKMVRTIKREDDMCYIFQTYSDWLQQNGIEPLQCEVLYTPLQKRRMKVWIDNLKDIKNRALSQHRDKTSANVKQFESSLNSVLQKVEMEYANEYPLLGYRAIQRLYSNLINNWTYLVRNPKRLKKTSDPRTDVRQKDDEPDQSSDQNRHSSSKRLRSRREPMSPNRRSGL